MKQQFPLFSEGGKYGFEIGATDCFRKTAWDYAPYREKRCHPILAANHLSQPDQSPRRPNATDQSQRRLGLEVDANAGGALEPGPEITQIVLPHISQIGSYETGVVSFKGGNNAD